MFPSILIVDDEPSILQSLGGLLEDEGFEVLTATNGYEALKIIDAQFPDLVLLDIWMPGMDGIETLREIKKDNPGIQVIIITGHGTIETAVKATKLGAFDFIEKPLSIDKIIVAINNALNFQRLEEENKYLRKKTIEKHSFHGNSPAVTHLRKQIAAAGPTDKWVLIAGENGTGKELVARSIHHLSPRSDQPLIDINCAAIPDPLIDSELFGHEKGAFDGAAAKKIGKLELATNGTLFLDEIGDMPLKTQAKMLRVLQERQFQRIGGMRVLHLNVRVIAASNKDLRQEIAKGTFREELYYRINVVPIEVPPLRDRREDIPLLIDIFLEEFSRESRKPRKQIQEDARDLLLAYPWPGNVRELKNLMERLSIMVEKEVIEVSDIPRPYNPGPTTGQEAASIDLFSIDGMEKAARAFETEYIRHKFLQNARDVSKTARQIGLDSRRLERTLKNMGLTPP
ncbi:MAG: sigma-54-dependent Fis family transcriptional regulator [Deltaproteobacteria bacterium]|nr:sigma-54-dependent Fis family transcriptional regulator [Deltaproteobacteria bacterium]MBW1954095.1 sigma-54-dependent Fis family transcriptional regulator [Deltaproteobacteria bacterium]MBW2040985.1 sigma-54-dependent Fis family transcriptional regulator [Deltaproteobacteria bacterium]MBW2131290.1 sigma-54-dependent Fis family transcriptional regulator [Deltaproteobacteria bacterium]